MKTGTTVRLIQPEIRGQVIERRISPDDEVEVLVAYTDGEGQTHQRWFPAAQLEAVQ